MQTAVGTMRLCQDSPKINPYHPAWGHTKLHPAKHSMQAATGTMWLIQYSPKINRKRNRPAAWIHEFTPGEIRYPGAAHRIDPGEAKSCEDTSQFHLLRWGKIYVQHGVESK